MKKETLWYLVINGTKTRAMTKESAEHLFELLAETDVSVTLLSETKYYDTFKIKSRDETVFASGAKLEGSL